MSTYGPIIEIIHGMIDRKRAEITWQEGDIRKLQQQIKEYQAIKESLPSEPDR